MKMKKLIADLNAVTKQHYEYNKKTKEMDEMQVSPTVIEREGDVIISGEDGLYFVDYYGELTGEMFIHPDLEAVAEKHGGYWEWENPGCIIFAQ